MRLITVTSVAMLAASISGPANATYFDEPRKLPPHAVPVECDDGAEFPVLRCKGVHLPSDFSYDAARSEVLLGPARPRPYPQLFQWTDRK
jgi:hypothetical protein